MNATPQPVAAPPTPAEATTRKAAASQFLPETPFRRLAWLAGLFCCCVGLAMLYQHHAAADHDPWKSPQLLQLKAQLRTNPADESIKQEIRRLDLAFRQRYVRRLFLDRTGGWLLLGGLATMVVSNKQIQKLRALPWLPAPDRKSGLTPAPAQSRQAVGFIALGLGSILTFALLLSSPPVPLVNQGSPNSAALSGAGGTQSTAVSLAAFRAQWPRFRGADGSGFTSSSNIVLEWNASTGSGISWKTPLPLPGNNSPIIWDRRVFLSGSDLTTRSVYCFDLASGHLLWSRAITNVPGSPAKPPPVPETTGYACPTMASDGERVFASFGNGDLAALTFDGNLVWTKHLGVPKNPYGHASSLAAWPGKIVVQLDQEEGAPGGSRLIALDGATGRILWERTKPTHGSWASPIILEAAGEPQIITLGLPLVMSHALNSGTEIWRVEGLEGEITPSPIFAAGLVLAVSPAGNLLALRCDGHGDVSKSQVAWKGDANIPDITSPVSDGDLLFTVTSSGMLACFEMKDGRKLWDHDLDLEVQASPSIFGKNLLILGQRGTAVVLSVAREFKELHRNVLPDQFLASPAFGSDGRMVLRGVTNLWCLARTEAKVP